jgi:alpha-L-fucosidase
MIKFEASWESLSQFRMPDWLQDSKLGIFIHWGLYSVPAFDNEWYSRNMYLQGNRAYEHHCKTWGHPSQFGYKDFIPHFKAENFDAQAWARLFKASGAGYVVPVAEHHDGFAMYDSQLSAWTAAKMGPKRDIIGELSAAIRGQDMIFGLSNHRAEHWWFMNGGKEFDSDVQNPDYDDFYGPAASSPKMDDAEAWHSRDWQPRPDKEFLEDWLARNIELVDKYQPQLVYLDWWTSQLVFEPYLRRFAAHYYNRGQERGKQVAINGKHEAFAKGTAIFGVERGQLTDIHPHLWQAATSVSKSSWCYVQNHDYKSSSSILHDIIDVVSKNGTNLLNIGPRADGTIPEEEETMLREIGAWLSVNAEAIHASKPWKIYGEGPTAIVEGEFQETKRSAYTAQDIRFTSRGKSLYAIALGFPDTGEIVIKSLGTGQGLYAKAIGKIEAPGSKQALEFSRGTDGLCIKLPESFANQPAIALKIEEAW